MTPAEYHALGDKPKKRSKFRNVRTTVDGEKFDSKREARRWVVLRQLERAGQITKLRRQVMWPLRVRNVLVCHYRSDFDYVENSKIITEDSKGFRTPEYKIKAALFAIIYRRPIRET